MTKADEPQSFQGIYPRLENVSNLLFLFQIKPPFKPVVKSDTDVSNFDEDFTNEPVDLSPADGNFIYCIISANTVLQ